MRWKTFFSLACVSLLTFAFASEPGSVICNDMKCIKSRGTPIGDGFDYTEDKDCPGSGCFATKHVAKSSCYGPAPLWDGHHCMEGFYETHWWYMNTPNCFEDDCDYTGQFWFESAATEFIPTCSAKEPCINTDLPQG
ncbi:MAG: hypothetical protein KF812_06605 [Fimbriimonadaceae bacterium]|nr:hypothetical protein [Fimbriimonadaceae bacterium]